MQMIGKNNLVWRKTVELLKQKEKELWWFIQYNIHSKHFLN